MNKLKFYFYSSIICFLIIFFGIGLAASVIELLPKIIKIIIDMLIGIGIYYLCKDIFKILREEYEIECIIKSDKKE